jgi:hypothetical protein
VADTPAVDARSALVRLVLKCVLDCSSVRMGCWVTTDHRQQAVFLQHHTLHCALSVLAEDVWHGSVAWKLRSAWFI